jgi:hypothetical protein
LENEVSTRLFLLLISYIIFSPQASEFEVALIALSKPNSPKIIRTAKHDKINIPDYYMFPALLKLIDSITNEEIRFKFVYTIISVCTFQHFQMLLLERKV